MQFLRFLLAIAFLLASASAAHAQTTFPPFPPNPMVKMAVNPVTNKVYVTNTADDTVTVFNATTGTSNTIAVGDGPTFIAVNPVTNRIYVNNGGAASLSVIDGATDTVIETKVINAWGPITVNPVTNVVYIVRMTSSATDEVTFFNGATHEFYTIATEAFQPLALAVNPNTNRMYVAHYASGEVRVISAAYDINDFHPATMRIGVWSRPFAVAVNPVTNKVYVIGEDSRGPIGVIDGSTPIVDDTNDTAVFPSVTAGHGVGPQAIAVNPVTNKVYAAFNNEIIVIDGATNALTYIPISGAASDGIALGINYATNRIFVATELGALHVIDGSTDTVISTSTVPVGTSVVGVNPLTNTVYFFETGLTSMAGGGTASAVGPTTTITPLAGDTSGASGSITLSASSSLTPVRAVYYRLDSTTGPWTQATPGSGGTFTASFAGLTPGSHTLYAFAVDSHVAPLSTGPQSIPLVGAVASYTFTAGASKADPTVSLISSANPSTVGQSVTFTASVSGSAGTPTGTVTFFDGGTALCSAVALSSGSAICATSGLSAGSHSITAQYSGDTAYNGATSGAVGQTVARLAASISLASSANPSTTGQSVTFTATVSGTAGVPTGTVTFRDGTTAICTAVALSSGTATCATAALSAGGHSLSAEYSGDGIYNASSSTALSQTVMANATVSLSSSANPSVSGQSVTFTATVSGPAGTPSGSVTFKEGATTLCAAIGLASGTAACTTSALTVGSHTITAEYSGNGSYNAATSSGFTQNVNNIPVTPQADMSVSQSANPSPVTAGGDVTFTLTATNNGPSPATGVVLNDTLPGGTSFVSASAACGHSSGTVTCSLGSVAAGASVQVTVVVRTASAGSITNNASVSATQADPTASNNQSALAVTVNAPAPAQADLALSQSATPNPATPGQDITFTVTVVNNGPASASGVTLTDTLPAGATLVSVSGGCAIGSGTLTCPLGTLAAGASATTTLVLRGSAAGTLTNTASVSASQADPNAGNNQASLAVTVNAVESDATVANLSTRGSVGGDNDPMIGGFVIGGSTPKTVVVAVTGPSLTAFGVQGALSNPKVTLLRFPDNAVIATNDNWGDAPNAAAIQTSGFAPTHALESAILVTLPPGAYTAIVTGVDGARGVALVAAYEVDNPDSPLVNISTRGQVGAGSDVMIGGFVIAGSSPKTIVITATGPSLASFGVQGALGNPRLQLVRLSDQALMAENDNWADAPNASLIQSMGYAPAHGLESAILVTLPPGAYTAIVSGVGGGTGVGLVALYPVE